MRTVRMEKQQGQRGGGFKGRAREVAKSGKGRDSAKSGVECLEVAGEVGG